MKLLLTAVNAKYIHSNPAVYLLKAFAGEHCDCLKNGGTGVELAISEYTINQRPEEILADIYRQHPDVVLFSCYIWNMRTVSDLLADLPKILPGTDFWLGGPEVSFHAEKVLERFPQLTGIMAGEGEIIFARLVDAYAGGLPLPRILSPNEPLDLAELPFIYKNGFQTFENRIIYYETSRGCPFSCSYCLSSVDKTVRLRPARLVLPELQFFLDAKVPQVKFVDRTFNCNREHTNAIWTYLLEHDNGITNFHFEIEAELLNDEEIALIGRMRPGLIQLEIGVQSANPQTLKEIRRPANLDHLRSIVDRIRAGRNIHQHLDLIAGLPYEDYESFGKSFDWVYRCRPDQLQLGFLKILKGAYMEEKTADYGIACTEEAPYEVLFTDWLSYNDVKRLKGIEEMVELYYNSGQFTAMLPALETVFDRPFTLFEKLAEYYRKMGYVTNTPARVRRYEILLEFACREAPDRAELWKELLTFDIYLREKAKSRPAFAKDLRPWEDALRTLRLDKKCHADLFAWSVWDIKDLRRLEQPQVVAFDYETRDPLDHNARIFFPALPLGQDPAD